MNDRLRRRWRFYATRSGRQPVKRFLEQLAGEQSAAIVAEMDRVARLGLSAARHLRGDIYEVRTIGRGVNHRVLFAAEGRHSQILLALDAFTKKTQKTPRRSIALAERRLADWRERGRRR